MPLNRSFIGKVYDGTDPWTVEASATKAYALATNIEHPHYLDESRPGGIIAPPMYGVVYQFLPMGAPLFDPELGVNMMRLVHGEHDMRYLAPVKPGDVIKSVTVVKNITDKTSGELLELTITSTNQRGEKVNETLAGLFIRGRVRRAPGAPAAAPDEERKDDLPPEGKVLFEKKVDVAKDQSLRYADASGDHNPIHKEPEMAKAAGLPDIILHGLCSMAFVHNAIVEHFAKDAPMNVKRLRVRFAKPVLNGETLTVKVHETGNPNEMAVEVYNPAGQAVIKSGLVELG